MMNDEEFFEKIVDFYNEMLYFRDNFTTPGKDEWYAVEDLICEYQEKFNIKPEDV